MRPHEFFPNHFGIYPGVIHVRVMFRKSCQYDFMGVASGITRKQNITENSLIFLLLQYLHPHNFCNTP